MSAIPTKPKAVQKPGKAIQPKLVVNDPSDEYEQEADAMADRVMRMSSNEVVKPVTGLIGKSLQRKCAHCEEEEKRKKPVMRKAELGSSGMSVSSSFASSLNASKGGGSSLPQGTRSFMENAFSSDFSKVKIHTDAQASEMSKGINAKAFTTGNDIYFNERQYSPNSCEGKHLLAHELTHTIQQGSMGSTYQSPNQHAYKSVVPMISRFTDTNHHIIEEAALSGSGFTEEQRYQIERGNVERDYSQLPGLLNLALLCQPDTFGGYHAADHFDNYVWNPQLHVFEDRIIREAAAVGFRPLHISSDPIQQIKDNILVLMESGSTPRGLQHLGAAFHAIEDFFAHSNFVELTRGDFRFGHELITGSNDPGASQRATANLFNEVSPPGYPATSPEFFENLIETSPPLSHSRIAKDYRGDPLHFEARRLAALVVQDLSRTILNILTDEDAERRRAACIIRVFPNIESYLSPPNPEVFPWWDTLIATDRGAIDGLLAHAEQRTPATVNQCVLSPFVNLEATRKSSMRSFGMASPVIGLGRLALSPLLGGNLTDIGLGFIPSVTVPFNINDHKASLTIGGITYVPMGALNTLLPNESRYFPESQSDRRIDDSDKIRSGAGVTVNFEF